MNSAKKPLPLPVYVLLAAIVIPGAAAFVFSLPLIFFGFHTAAINYVVGCLALLAGGAVTGVVLSQLPLPAGLAARYLPPAALPCLAVLLCALGLAFSGGDVNSAWLAPYGLSQLAFFPALLYAALSGGMAFMFVFPFLFHLTLLGTFTLLEHRREDRVLLSRRLVLSALGILAALLAVIAAFYFVSRRNLLPASYGMAHGGGFSSVDLWAYDLANPENRLPRLTEPSTFTVADPARMPVLDGAEAAYPVYAAFANACYENIAAVETSARNQKDIQHDQSGGRAITFTNTIYAYERLLSGEVDIFFGAQPSESQKQLAQDAGKTLVLTPIGLEAFVFFVSAKNPVAALTSEQIRAVYSGKLKNWSALGGADLRILAFQRPENSGSQTIMQKFMGETHLQKPLEEEYSPGMGGTVRRVAEYRNAAEAIGYSFRYFLTGMADSSDVKLLAVDGVSPTAENIASRAYPYTVELYAITLADNQNENTAPFLAWMQSAQGQELVEGVGYVPLPY